MSVEKKIVYTCDNCFIESTNPDGWIQFRKPLMGQYYLSKTATFHDKDCLDSWLLKWARENTLTITTSDKLLADGLVDA